MGQKSNFELTNEEKIEFLAKFNYHQMYLKLENYYCNSGVRKALSIMTTVLNLGLCGLCIAFMNPITTIMAFTFLTAWASTLHAINIIPQTNLSVKLLECSNGKIDLQKFYELEKLGEIDKWKKQFKNELLKYDYSKFEYSVSEYASNHTIASTKTQSTPTISEQENTSAKQTSGNER